MLPLVRQYLEYLGRTEELILAARTSTAITHVTQVSIETQFQIIAEAPSSDKGGGNLKRRRLSI